MRTDAAPIGVFDSGVGGLTVLRALRRALPAADFIYLGDTARLPYGTKSAATVARYSLQCAAALRARGIGGLVVACNTASASALEPLRREFADMPVVGVIEPGAAAAVAASRAASIAVIGTEGTIAGGAYQDAIRRHGAQTRVVARACPLFVALAEEGWTEGPLTEAVAHRYLDGMFDGPQAPDTLVLGCTHFPLLAAAIAAVVPPAVRIVDSAATTAAAVQRLLGDGRAARGAGRVRWLATDGAARFAQIGSLFFGEALSAGDIEIIDL
ncbi:MAG TPA: glutamate racemase [Steroidobacteraceae bacterium]|nr:glutamate racemase [Steroidobacteraceae bacterium]